MTSLTMIVAVVLLAVCSSLFADPFAWKTAKPAEQGMDEAKLKAIADDLFARSTECFLVVRGDRIVFERYANGFGPDKKHYTASLAKAMVGGMSLLVALDDGKISPDDLASKYVPAWKDDPLKSKITVRHLASHSSGLADCTHDKNDPTSVFWEFPKHFVYARDTAKVLFEPGKSYQYSNPGMAMLGWCITAAMKDTKTSDLKAVLNDRVYGPIGAKEICGIPSYGGGKPVTIDGLDLYPTWGGTQSTARGAGLVGRLMLRKGDWDGKRILSAKWIEAALKDANGPPPDRDEDDARPRSGLAWWLNVDGVWTGVPKDAFAGAGAQNQVLFVVPSLDLIAVRFGKSNVDKQFWRGLHQHMFLPLVESCGTVAETTPKRAPAYPPSDLIVGVVFDPIDKIVRDAADSDNWPVTWADDDAQYTSYGDGWGFEPRTKEKLSLGIAKVTGGPDGFNGENVRSASAERPGDGAKGPKASGMLCVDGALYMLVRNVGNSQLAWSKDHGKIWTWADWKLSEGFGAPTFLNFGKNYAGARDNYVYVYSQDGPSAYENCDGVALARMPKGRILDRAAWEFFEKSDADGNPAWTDDIAKRGRVFVDPGRCYRMDVAFHPGLKRYLLAKAFHNAKGAWGLYEAPEPWGPWRTVFETEDWGMGDTHGLRLPTKWFDADGRTIRIVFSGRPHEGVNWDSFCVRKAVLKVAPK